MRIDRWFLEFVQLSHNLEFGSALFFSTMTDLLELQYIKDAGCLLHHVNSINFEPVHAIYAVTYDKDLANDERSQIAVRLVSNTIKLSGSSMPDD